MYSYYQYHGKTTSPTRTCVLKSTCNCMRISQYLSSSCISGTIIPHLCNDSALCSKRRMVRICTQALCQIKDDRSRETSASDRRILVAIPSPHPVRTKCPVRHLRNSNVSGLERNSARAHFLDLLAQTARKSATLRKPTLPGRSSILAKPDEKARGSADPIIVTESEDAPVPSRSKQQSQRKSAAPAPQPKPLNGNGRGKGKTQGPQHDDPIDLEPDDSASGVSDVEMSIPAPRQRSSPNESSAVLAKEGTLQRKLLQVSPPGAEKSPGGSSTPLQRDKTIESLQKQIDELLDAQMGQQQALESWKTRQEASNGCMSFERVVQLYA